MITGPRQVGKSTLLNKLIEHVKSNRAKKQNNGTLSINKNYFSYSLDDINLRSALKKDIRYIEKDIDLALGQSIYDIDERIYIFIDEIQKYPKLLEWIKRVFDANNQDVKFVLAGSSALDLTDSLSESLAGRVEYVHIYPILYRELLKFRTGKDIGGIYNFFRFLSGTNSCSDGSSVEDAILGQLTEDNSSDLSDIKDELLKNLSKQYSELKEIEKSAFSATIELMFYGGLPRLYQTPIDKRMNLVSNYINVYLEKEVGALSRNLDLELFGLSLQSFARQNGEPLNLNLVAQNVGVGRPSLYRYLQLLENTYLIKRIYPYNGGVGHRRSKSVALYFLDNGLLNNLLYVNSINELKRPDILVNNLRTFVLVNLLGEFSYLGNVPLIQYWQDYDRHRVSFAFDYVGYTIGFKFAKQKESINKVVTSLRKFVEEANNNKVIIFVPYFSMNGLDLTYEISDIEEYNGKQVIFVSLPVEML